ncbi:hypothetical protein QMY03_08805 [Arthrobacter sp. KFRI-F3372]|nr:hypothetical protein QMY03_08805 [Arthrobacter sp. KFRI-F3372]
MAPPRFDVDNHHPSVLQGGEVLGNARLASADGGDYVSPRCRPPRGQKPQDFVSRPVSEGSNGSLNVSRPSGVVWLSNPRHSAILPDLHEKSKKGTLDDTLSIFDNNFYSF